jgi:hypothetical protein
MSHPSVKFLQTSYRYVCERCGRPSIRGSSARFCNLESPRRSGRKGCRGRLQFVCTVKGPVPTVLKVRAS